MLGMFMLSLSSGQAICRAKRGEIAKVINLPAKFGAFLILEPLHQLVPGSSPETAHCHRHVEECGASGGLVELVNVYVYVWKARGRAAVRRQ